MIKIYGSKMSSAMRCIWLLEEMGVPYEIMPLDMQKGEHKSPEYLKLNPNGKVPTMVDGKTVLFESLAINTYLAETHKPELLGATPAERGEVNQWSLWALMHLYGDAMHALVMKKWRNTPESEHTKQALQDLPKWFGILNTHLTGKEYMVGGKFTLADINVMSVVNGIGFIEYDISAFPEVKRWHGMLMQREALKRLFTK